MTRVPAAAWSLRAAIVGTLAIAITCVDARVTTAAAQQQAGTPGQRIEAHDGDLVVVTNDARVRAVRRRDATVRAVYNRAQRWLVLLVDYATPNGPDGRVDVTYTQNGLEGEWPLGDRWEGPAVIEDYLVIGETGTSCLGVVGPGGLVQLLNPLQDRLFRDPAAVAVLTCRNSDRGGGGGVSFDKAEQLQVDVATRNAEVQARLPAAASMSATLQAAGTSASGSAAAATGGLAPVRVGGNIRTPAKLVDVPPVLPDKAREAGIRGVVILEITIGLDGRVADVKILRSIPLLDAAAVEAARQWRYEPTLLNGRPVPVILTAPVSFQ